METRTKEKPEKNRELESRILAVATAKIDPNKWYGTCYGRELGKETGKYFQ